MFQKAHAREWNKFEVQGWIESLGVKGPDSEKLPDLFLKHCVDGDMLFSDIDDETLKELGVGFLQRKKIMRELLQLVCAVEERENWDKGSELEVWSNKYGQWVSGEILDVFTDEEGEWLEIGYKNFSKQVQRFCEDIRPLEKRVQERIQMKKNDVHSHLVTTAGAGADMHHSSPFVPPSRQSSQLTEKELHTFLPDPEARKIWLGCLPQPSRTVNIHILLQTLAQEFGRITSTQYRGLQLSDINYLTTLLRSRFDVKNNKVTIQIFSGFWSSWYYPLCETVKDIREIWDHNPTLVHGLVTKNTCEHKLKDSEPGTFLIRFSDSQGGCLSIVFFDGTRVRYLLVQPLRNKKHQFKICVGRAVKKSSFHQLILSLKRLTYLYNLQDDSKTDKSIFSHFDEKNEEFPPEVYEATQYVPVQNNRHKPVADASPASVPPAIFISGREGLDGKYIQQKDWRGGRPVYLGPVHPQENEQISLWFDDERSEWTLSLASFMGSAHCLAYVTHGASDPTQIPPQAVWSIASGVQSGWFEERLLIRSVSL